MPSLAFALRNLWRDLKSGELAVLVLALLVAVASLTAVGFFTSRIGLAVERQAGEVLAADLRLESARPVADTYDAEAARRGLRSARIESMPSVVFFGQESSLIALRAVGAGYPLRGRLKTADKPFGDGVVTDGIPAPGEAWADSRLLAKLGAQVGSDLTVGAHTVRVTRVLDYRPDQGSGFTDLAADADDQPRRSAGHPTGAARQSREPGRAVCGRARSGRRLPRVAHGGQATRREGAVDRRCQPADSRLGRSRGTLPFPHEPGERTAFGHRGGDGSTALRASSSRHRGTDEVHGRAAAVRADTDRGPARRHRGRDRRRRHGDRLRRAIRHRLAAARLAPGRPAAALGRCLSPGCRHRGRRAGRVRAAAAAAPEAGAARPCPAPRSRAAAAAVRRRLRPRDRCRARAAVLDRARSASSWGT